MRIYDISVPIFPGMVTYPGDPQVSLTPELQIARGDNANVSKLCLGDHTGTHLDPPVHFIPGGKTVDRLDLGVLYGPARVLDLTRVSGVITPEDLDALDLATGIDRVLFKTQNSQLWKQADFVKQYIGVSHSAADWLVRRGLKLVGIDYLSIESYDAAVPQTHRTLLGAGVVVVEGLDLREVTPGDYVLACFPLKIKDGDGGPLRAVLIAQ